MIEPEDPNFNGHTHPSYLAPEENEDDLPHTVQAPINGIPGVPSPRHETLVSDIGHGATLSEGIESVKVIGVQPHILDQMVEERDENEAPVHSNVLEN